MQAIVRIFFVYGCAFVRKARHVSALPSVVRMTSITLARLFGGVLHRRHFGEDKNRTDAKRHQTFAGKHFGESVCEESTKIGENRRKSAKIGGNQRKSAEKSGNQRNSAEIGGKKAEIRVGSNQFIGNVYDTNGGTLVVPT